MPKVSIIMPVYNQQELVVRALDSIPVRDDLEVIVIDDCSTDNTYEVLKGYTRLPIRLFHNETNKGAGYSRNVGLDNATGDYIYGIDSDDYLDTNKFNWFLDNAPFYTYDVIHIYIKVNSGAFWGPGCVGMPTKFIRRETIGTIRCPELNWAEDAGLWYAVVREKHPKECQAPKEWCFYNYNWPREGSLDWLGNRARRSGK